MDDPNFVGKWGLINGVFENENLEVFTKGLSCAQEDIQSMYDYGIISLEVKADGTFLFNSNYGFEKFKLVSKTERKIKLTNYKYNLCGGASNVEEINAVGYDIVLKNKKGLKFKFPLIYCKDLNKLITVPWVKGVPYHANDRVYVKEEFSPFNLFSNNGMGKYRQTLGKFGKL